MTDKSTSKGLLHLEQQVNSRYRAASAPDLPAEMLPETGGRIPLHWVALPYNQVNTFVASGKAKAELVNQVARDESILMPVHPLDKELYSPSELIASGTVEFSASYRTCAYKPEPGGPFSDWIPDGQLLMIKLHLEKPLPGIPGDRKLPRARIERCVMLSDAIPSEIQSLEMARKLIIVSEFFGISHQSRGALFRLLPASGIIPLFSLYSADRTEPARPPILCERIYDMYGEDSDRAAESFGAEFARPLLSSFLAAFSKGFSLEMHAQNTLVSLGSSTLIQKVWFRDLEGVVVFNGLRNQMGMPRLFENTRNIELIGGDQSPQRFYNRNIDHDLGRIFDGSITALRENGYFIGSQCEVARRSIVIETKRLVENSGLKFLNRWGALLPFSRAPWGNGLRRGHYFSTRFR